DRSRKAVQTFRGGSVSFAIDAQLTQQLKTLSQESGATLFMTGLAVFVTLLFRYSGQSDILVGSPIANRHYRETDSLIGFFVNTVVLRTQIPENFSFKELLHQVRQAALEAYTHQDVPFEQVVEALQPERSLSHSPLFQVMFDLLPEPEQWELPGLSLTPVETVQGTAKFDLTLSLENSNAGLRGVWEYNSDLFNHLTIVRMSSHFQTLLAAIIAHPEQPVEQLPLLSDQQRHQLLVEWNNTQREYPQHCLHELFEQQVQRSPDSVAVQFTGQHLTYRELDHRANQLANYLQTLGVGPETLVDLCVERDIPMLVGLLGILKAGGAYVPLDPNYPQERIAFTLSNSQATILLTQEKLAFVLPQDVHYVYLDRDWQAIAQQKSTKPNSRVSPVNLAYVIYTSGSTGVPKGVMIQHQSAVNFIASAKYDIKQGERVLQFVSIAFDAAVEDIFTCLTSGGTLVLRTDEMLLSASRFVQRCRDWNLTVLDLPTSYWHQLMVELATAEVTHPESLRLVFIGGEQAMPETLKLWHDSSQVPNQAQLINRYGPTETTVASTSCNLSDSIVKHLACSTVPIGYPMDNVCTYALDCNLQPVPIGIVGELHIGGIGLARGYLNCPEATSEKFIPDPFSNEPGARLYKTGDKVRYCSDGNIEYLGRIDQQVKVRGFRIELLEIESVLLQHPAVAQAVVILCEEQLNNKHLIAYIVATEGLNGTENLTHKIKADIRQQLPEYMIPATIMMLSALPLTTNGKVDRRALPTPNSVVRVQALEMPQTEIEKLIADAWQKILHLEKVGLDDNFFDVGGNSLRLVQVREELQTIFNQELSMVDMFQNPTVRALGEYLSGQANRTLSTSQSQKNSEQGTSDIAIIAMSGRFPGANNIDAFWENLRLGVESISWLSDEELLAAGVQPEMLQNPNYVRANAVLDDIELFDANFFGYNPKEAEILDPQNRLFLECAWETLEQAGYDPQTYAGSIGVYAGLGASDYLLENLYPNQALRKSMGMYQLMLATEKDFLPTRAAYKLNLTGPAVNIQTACSTSLVAVHMACQSLLNGECDMALAGGVSISIHQKAGYLYEEGMILSPDGHCRAFDAKAQGTMSGSGVGIVMLKRTKDAIADRDNIYAIIKGSAINNDGVNKIGFTAPSVKGQARVIASAQAQAGVETETITYVETHGTGTTLGDPIEIAALTQAFCQSGDKKHFCAIGSLKTNIGHLDTAAGVAGLIKTVLALKHKQLPPSLHFETPNPKIDFANSPFYVNTQLSEWKTDDTPRRAGVSSFGIGGTNAHVVVE
ncbi:MAG: amino acid adenylation domain-containing protein, partial [Rhizonema sp. PD38]|nr:amino acid adenylation domain-containing protein [Rhizonema sp. PD38]